MTKSHRTYELEEIITLATARPNRIGCPEVGLDDYGIVDYISMDLSGAQTVRCYEIKISKSDFLSDNKKTFIGDFNYYVLPTELYYDVKNLVEDGIGIWLVDKKGRIECKRQATRMECSLNRKRIMGKILRALNRENLKHVEQSWRDRQIAKRVTDAGGAEIAPGDAVSYRGEIWEVVSVDYAREDTSLEPTLTLVRSGGEADGVKPTVVKKTRLHAIM